MKAKARKILSWAFGVLSVLSLVAAGTGVVALAYQGKIAPNTIVGGVSVGGLSPEIAFKKINEQTELLNNISLLLEINETKNEATLKELGVSVEPSQTEIFFHKPSFLLGWLSPRYWTDIVKQKNLPIAYDINKQKLLLVVEDKFNLHNTAKNAQVIIANSKLVVDPAVSGKKIDIAVALELINNQLLTGKITPLTFTYTETPATISTAVADQTKTEVTTLLKPILLSGGERNFIISVADQYELIDYFASGSKLGWKVSEERLSTYLSNKVSRKLNIKMVQKIIQNQPEAVLQEGVNGRSVALPTLISSVYQRITEQNTSEPIVVPLETITFTEKRVDADYIPNLFPGRYVDLNLAKQRMSIVEGDIAIQTFLVSTGRASLPTPKGVFYIKNKAALAQSRLYPGLWLRQWNALAKNPDGSGYEGYGIHDLPCFNSSCTLVEGASHLGRPVSHGCVRLGRDEANWFFDNIPIGTPVNIH